MSTKAIDRQILKCNKVTYMENSVNDLNNGLEGIELRVGNKSANTKLSKLSINETEHTAKLRLSRELVTLIIHESSRNFELPEEFLRKAIHVYLAHNRLNGGH